jgi:hypothetical protein
MGDVRMAFVGRSEIDLHRALPFASFLPPLRRCNVVNVLLLNENLAVDRKFWAKRRARD